MSLKASAVKRVQQSEARPHQLGQEVFKTILSEDVDWKPFPAFPPSVRLAVVVGRPSEAGPYTIRVKTPHGEKLMPHRHPEDRVYTVISGVFYIGLGDEFDASNLEAYPPWDWNTSVRKTSAKQHLGSRQIERSRCGCGITGNQRSENCMIS